MSISLKKAIMERDDLSSEEADEQIKLAKERVRNGENPEEVLEEEFGLEVDFIFDILDDVLDAMSAGGDVAMDLLDSAGDLLDGIDF